MKFAFIIGASILTASCSSAISVKNNDEYAYIFTKYLDRTKDCKGESIEIVGVSQPGKNVTYINLHSIYVPAGGNTIYFKPVFESLENGVCTVLNEERIWLNGTPSKKYHSSGFPFNVSVDAGKSYELTFSDGIVSILEEAR